MTPQPITRRKRTPTSYGDRLRDSVTRTGLRPCRVRRRLPEPRGLEGDLPPGIDAAQVLPAAALDDPNDAIDRLVTFRSGSSRIGADGVQAVLDVLRPERRPSSGIPRPVHATPGAASSEISRDHTRALESLDLNRRVCVTGGAGTGKTRLAIAWARRAAARGERVLVTCFNEPLADVTAERLDDLDITVGNFHNIARFIDGMPPLEVPDDADGTWWDTVMTGHLVSNWHAGDRPLRHDHRRRSTGLQPRLAHACSSSSSPSTGRGG